MSFSKEQARVAIVGAGIAGISTAIALKRQIGFENFVVYEKASTLGGTWRDNTYPGCSSDVAGHWYSLSTDLNPNWSSYYPSQPEIQAYWIDLVRKYKLAPRIVYDTLVTSAAWDDEARVYQLTLTDAVTGAEREERVEVLVSAIGGFVEPAYPKDMRGRHVFAGEVFHSARWRHDVELKGKRVGVIGNGCSAAAKVMLKTCLASRAQFVPEISEDPSVEVINFCRTPSWFVPRVNFKYPPWVKWVFAHVPLVMRIYRSFVAARYDKNYLGFLNSNKGIQAILRKQLKRYIRDHAPADQIEKLLPNYPPGCKRMIVDPGYLESLKRLNVSLNWDGIDAIVPEGIKTKKGEVIPLDVIIFGTGFEVMSWSFNVRGNNGLSIAEYFDSKGGPTAYLGTTVPGFPNLFIMMGPNTATGHASVIFTEEVQINYAVQMMKPIVERTAQAFEVRAEACDEYNGKIQERIAGSVFTACVSWYRGDAGQGKNFVIFPGPLMLYWWWARVPKWEHYKAIGAARWAAEMRGKTLRRGIMGVGLALLVTFWSRLGLMLPL